MLALVRMFTTVILEVTLFLSVAVTVAYAVFLYLDKNFGAAIIMTIVRLPSPSPALRSPDTVQIAVFSIIAYFPMRRRIPFSRQLLLFVLRIAKEYPSVYVIALLGAVVQSAYSVFWSFTTVAIYQQYANNSPKQTGLLVYSVFSFYWTSRTSFLCSKIGLTRLQSSSSTISWSSKQASLEASISRAASSKMGADRSVSHGERPSAPRPIRWAASRSARWWSRFSICSSLVSKFSKAPRRTQGI